MHKVKKLEDKWFQYKAKKLLLPIISLSSLYLLFIGSYYIYENQASRLLSLPFSNKVTTVLGVSIEANNSVIEKVKIVKKEEIVKKEVIPKVEEVEETILVPIIPVIDMEKEERISAVKRVKSVRSVKPVKVANTVKAKRNNYLTAKELAVITKVKKRDEVAPRKTKKMNFTSTSSNYLERIKHKFSKSNTPRDALLLAKAYYKNADYEASEKWALTANKLDNSLEDSWLLFAKSKAKLGKNKEALKILVSYYKKSHSIKAKKLIGKIRTGQI